MNTQKTSWELTVEEDPETGEFFLQFPKEFLDTQGWREGDDLKWTDNQDGSWTLSKIKKT